MTAAVEFSHVDILFRQGPDGGRRDPSLIKALELLAAGRSRGEISDQTGVVLGVADANLTVKAGEISVLMGFVGVWQVPPCCAPPMG